MNSIYTYFIQSIICMALFYAIFWIFLKNETFFRTNRMFLLLTLVASMFIPMLEIPFKLEPVGNIETPYNIMDAVVITSQQILNSSQLEEVVVTASKVKNISLLSVIRLLYTLGVIFFLYRFIFNLSQLAKWIRRGNKIKKNGFILVLVDEDHPPFSFLNYVFINNRDYARKNFKTILSHELVHVKQYHTFDIFISEFLCIIMWFNPLIWLYKTSLKEVHEYLADDEVANGSVNPNEYKKQIINQFMGGLFFKMANNFGQSKLKKRILMIGRIKSPKIALVKLLLTLPVSAFLISAFAFTVYKEKKMNLIQYNKKENIYGDNMKIPYFWKSITTLTHIPSEEKKNNVIAQKIDRLQYKLEDKEDKKEYISVDEMPEFYGGTDALKKYITKTIKYPEIAINKGLHGKIFVKFIINRKGMVENAQITKSVHPILDEEALRVVKKLPKWKPGKNNGHVVRVLYTLPINFTNKYIKTEPVKALKSNEISPLVQKQQNSNIEPVRTLEKNKVFVEQMPQFPGGLKQLKKFLANNIKYPQKAIDYGKEGKVFVSFVVDENGKVTRAKVEKGISSELNREAMRVVQSMPPWKPGKQSGQKTAVSYTVPIKFVLN